MHFINKKEKFMAKLEKEIKVLDINIEKVKKRFIGDGGSF